ncbi:MAG TPA: TauD/TfdA family dioxygenase, partial [Hyphomicrobiaceae bacterium]|nr:TauD/TfdA family dioxygenase [Hyphomicrobiaceae bacterium]
MATAQQMSSATSAPNWPFEVRKLHPAFGAEIIGLPLADAVKDENFPKVYECFLEHKLILFRGVDLPQATQVAFAKRFGPVQVHVMNQYHGRGHPEIYYLSNLDDKGQPNGKHPDKGTLYWHTDGSWRDVGTTATMMYSEVVPEAGGHTEFADTCAAYDALSPEWKLRIADLKAVHNLDFSRTRRHGHEPMTAEQKAKVPPVAHPIARVHPETGRRAIYLGDHAESIAGMDYAAGRALIEELNVLATPQHVVYSHAWKPGECIVWDNRSTLHRATGFDT